MKQYKLSRIQITFENGDKLNRRENKVFPSKEAIEEFRNEIRAQYNARDATFHYTEITEVNENETYLLNN
jgi:hypothetical protein